MTFLKVKNRAFSTLASGVDDAVTSWTLATGEGSKFPTTGDFHVTCEDEIVKCTSRSGDVLTVTRAQEGTDAAAHDSGKAVELRVTAGVIDQIETEFNDHSARHENGGADEINVAGLSGELADNQPPKAHKDSHDPEDGADKLDTAAPSELASVQAAGAGSSHSFARADHQHQIQHSIADNHLVTIDGATNQPVANDYSKFTANGLEGRSYAEVLSDLSGQAGGAFNFNGQNVTLNNLIIADAGTIGSASDTDAMAIAADGKVTLTQPIITTSIELGHATDTTLSRPAAGRLQVEGVDVLKQAGNAAWENRTYEGWEIVDTNTTYTIGSGQDFETLGACASALQGLILAADITVQLAEAIELTSTVTFTGMISAGGRLILDINGYDITINCNAVGIAFDGQFYASPRDLAASPYNSIIAKADGDCSTSTYLVRWMNYANGLLYNINLDANSETINAHLLISNDARCLVYDGNADFLDTGSGGNYSRAVHVRYGGAVAAGGDLGVGSDELTIDTGGMAIDDDGHIHTEAGEWNTPDA